MLKIRLRRVGMKKAPNYRIVIADSAAPRDGAFKEVIGFYNPLPDPPVVEIDEEKASYWLQRGAQPSDPVARILKQRNLLTAVTSNEGAD